MFDLKIILQLNSNFIVYLYNKTSSLTLIILDLIITVLSLP